MNKKTYIFITLIPFLLTACQQLTQTQSSDGTYEVSLGESDLQYVPTTASQLDDSRYMNLINTLIEEKAAAITSDQNFLKLAKAIAWTESSWRHYYEENGKYYVHLGDEGHSYGMMQIYDTYHGEHPILQDNIEYGLAFAYEKYTRAQSNDCDTGTNVGSSETAIARRTYAQYNGGDGAICRDNDGRDNNLEDAYTSQPWTNYL
jgi:hypothetical protein